VFLPRFNSEDTASLKEDTIWRLIWLFPIVLELLTLVLVPMFYKHLSLKTLI
jgi:hypothetical protein